MLKEIIMGVVLGTMTSGITFAAETGPREYCTAAASLYEEGDIEGAIEEAKWCLESLEQIVQARKSEAFAEEVNGWVRGEISQQKMMGFSLIETKYTKEGKTISVNYNSGVGGMGGMFNQMAMSQAGQKIRIQHYTAIVMDKGNQTEIMIGLKTSGGMLNLSSSDTTKDELVDFAKQFPIKQVDR